MILATIRDAQMSEKRGRGQPKFEPTPDQRSQVKLMKAMGIPEDRARQNIPWTKKLVPIQGGPDRRWVRGRAAGERWQVEHDVAPKMRVASEEVATEGRARQLEVTVAKGQVVRIAFPPAGSLPTSVMYRACPTRRQ